ncbi:MAG: [ribosomal protein S5]-alanine N-acetyltransferase, partial [Streptomycetaceae bacterium]|nr:[ribosomal protein S5]-alanine N-acetyltransferase [Streptomycetaceae bacterium]
MMLIMPSLVAPAIPVGAFAAPDQPTLPIGSRVLLRPWRLADAEAVTEAFQNPEIQRWHMRRADSVEEARKWIEDWQSSWRSEEVAGDGLGAGEGGGGLGGGHTVAVDTDVPGGGVHLPGAGAGGLPQAGRQGVL